MKLSVLSRIYIYNNVHVTSIVIVVAGPAKSMYQV